jgi:low affinity Fe/Cu permease
MKQIFRQFAANTAEKVGSPWSFLLGVVIVLLWAAAGPVYHYSDTWQLVINTGTTVVTFLMVFVIQNSQNRDAKAIHLKLDELIRAVKGARNGLVNLEDLSDEELDWLRQEFRRLRERCGPEPGFAQGEVDPGQTAGGNSGFQRRNLTSGA